MMVFESIPSVIVQTGVVVVTVPVTLGVVELLTMLVVRFLGVDSSGLEICGPVVVLVGTPSVEVFAVVPEMS